MVISAMVKKMKQEVRAESSDGWEQMVCCEFKLGSGH